MGSHVSRAALATLLVLSTSEASAAAAASAVETSFVAVTDSGALIAFDAANPGQAREIQLSGLSGQLIGVDVRPADRKLYGLTDANEVYRIDPRSGAAELVSSLTLPFDGATFSGVDFSPLTDRLRLVSSDGANLRVNVDLGAAARDEGLAYAPGDPGEGRRPAVTAAAYTRPVAGTPESILMEIDAGLDVLVRHDPPNDGALVTVGPLDADFAPEAGFDIVTDPGGADHGWAASGGTLHRIDLATGKASPAGTIGGGGIEIVGLAAYSPPP